MKTFKSHSVHSVIWFALQHHYVYLFAEAGSMMFSSAAPVSEATATCERKKVDFSKLWSEHSLFGQRWSVFTNSSIFTNLNHFSATPLNHLLWSERPKTEISPHTVKRASEGGGGISALSGHGFFWTARSIEGARPAFIMTGARKCRGLGVRQETACSEGESNNMSLNV